MQDSELEPLLVRYQALKEEVTRLGLISQGSLTLRHTQCGRRGCRCQADPPQPHGPYYQWTRKVGGKTVTRRLTPPQANLYQEWISSRRALDDLLRQMEATSEQAIEVILQRQVTATAGKKSAN